jgi:HTH-type transcriptional regulator, sugar sensing transcriptional regulator
MAIAIDKIAVRMKRLGFTAYEAKAYISLLRKNPATRYELSKNSGVPRSAIYDTIRKLEAMGAVNGTYTEPKKFMPLPPDELFNLLERQFKESVDDVRELMNEFETSIEPGHLWNILGYKNMIHKAREMIDRAEETIYVSLWQREADLLKNEFKNAYDRGVKIIAFSFTNLNISAEWIYNYCLKEEDLEKIWAHKIIMVVDRQELIMGEANNHYAKKTAWTYNTALVDIAINHMILDLTLYGMRNNVDLGDIVISMQKGELTELQDLLDHSSHEAVRSN